MNGNKFRIVIIDDIVACEELLNQLKVIDNLKIVNKKECMNPLEYEMVLKPKPELPILQLEIKAEQYKNKGEKNWKSNIH